MATNFTDWAKEEIEAEYRRWGFKLPERVILDLMTKAWRSGREVQIQIDTANRTNYDNRSLIH